MKTINSIPKSKIARATKLVQTGAKVGVNYLKYYGDKLTKGEPEARDALNESNAEDIYEGFSNLKGSTLKVAQMLSMEQGILPEQYVEKFSLSQFSVPPLSTPLVRKTFRKYYGRNPEEIYDLFTPDSVNAASIGQVHYAEKDNKKLAVKIQYPGVADSIVSDLTMVKPLAMRMFNLRGKDSNKYFQEVEDKLLEETNYLLEIKQSKEVRKNCAHLPNLRFPNYYDDLSCERIITMDWMEGKHLSEFIKQNPKPDQAVRNKLGQTLWDFYMFQIHTLRKVHADPHPGNFLVSDTGELIALDFGCMKELPTDFYRPYFELVNGDALHDEKTFENKLWQLDILRKDDSPTDIDFFKSIFHTMITLFSEPFRHETFDFSDEAFFNQLYQFGEKMSRDKELRKMNANRGSKHFIYMHRTFFGLYNLLFKLEAKDVTIRQYINYGHQ